ncbi:hypothetical protein MMC15_004327 [Xylographa vitiligo]|nr:hypothetical protein [Xylographa vitiligo]
MAMVSLVTIGWVALAIFLYNAALVIYRLYFHPLARFPGPKVAAATAWWECLQDVFAGQGGTYMNQVEEMHDIYGPIVRVTPDEVHIRDSQWSHVLYAGPGHKRDKDPSLAHAAGTADGTFGTVSHTMHRRRRVPVSSYFSKNSVTEMQDRIWERAGHMCDVFQKHYQMNRVVNGRATFLGWSNDTLRSCAFGECLNLLDDPQRAMAFDLVFKAFARFYPILKQFEWIIPVALELPIGPFWYIYTPLATLLTVHVEMIRLADKSRQEHEATQRLEKLQGIQIDSEKRNYDSLYHAILASSLPEEEKRPERMAHEGFEVLLAGSDTTARTMGIAVFHVLANKDIQVRLRKELETVMPDPQSVIELRTLQGLPWLNSIIKEALRIGKVTDHRLSLIPTEESLQFQDWIIPAGSRVSMTPTRNSYDIAYFPNPTVFTPERWLQSEEKVAAMKHIFMPFAAGRRGCLGMHFANAELHIGLARMFRQFEFELHDTIRERDIDHTWAHIAGEPDKSGKGLRFKVTKVL